MAEFRPTKPPKPIEIDQFLGVNESVGNTEIKSGESVEQLNFRITKNYKAQKRPGHHTFVDFGTGAVQGIWEGIVDDKNIMILCHGGNVYEYDMTIDTPTILIADLITEGTVTIIGTIADLPTDITFFASALYFKNKTQFKTYDGTTYGDIDYYIPTIAIAAPPTGGGTLFEEINLATGEKSQEFIGDGTALYTLAEQNIDSLDLVEVNGVPTATYTFNLVTGVVTFNGGTEPLSGDIVKITWTKVIAGNLDLILNHKYMYDYGYGNDTTLFLFGSETEQNVFRHSGVGKPNYWPASAFVAVGTDEFAITDLKSQYQSLVIFKEQSTHVVPIPSPNPNFANNTGLYPYIYEYQDLNESVGNLAPKMVQLIENDPVSLQGYSMWLWSSDTSVETERNANIISDRLKLSLQGLNLATAVTFDYQNQKEYWVNVSGTVYIWNYGNDTMYKYTNFNAYRFIEVGADVFYSSDGTVERVKESYTADGETLGTSIPCKMYLGFTDFGMLNYRKMMRDEWIAINPSSRTSIDVTFITDRENEGIAKVYSNAAVYKLFDFNNIDFNDFTFETNRNPQPQRLKAKVKKFTYVQVLFENDTTNEDLTLLKLVMQAQVQGYSR